MFHENVATRPSAEIPSVSSTPPSRRVRSAHSAYDSCSRPDAVAVVIPFVPKYRSHRSKRCTSVNGTSCIRPFIRPPTVLQPA